ncbi:hypothetical protein DFH07DRAFT_1062012 [Mycena maculata]|uniref:Uncharacterized protein n=1 Tax=Mycena maculata TaxID=230809 RepID=A0AAD7IUW5_9AGAR|nr:hypothetical protein DFH07DRAFT_1062012 [Mycena maculata]
MISFVTLAVALGAIRSATANPFPVTVTVTVAATCTPAVNILPFPIFASPSSGAPSSVLNVETALPSISGAALTVVPSVASITVAGAAAAEALATLVDIIILISEGLVANNIPGSLTTALNNNLTAYATALVNLGNAFVNGSNQATSTFITSTATKVAKTLQNSFTPLVIQLATAGKEFNAQFDDAFSTLLAALGQFSTAISNPPALSNAITNLDDATEAL